MHPIVKVMEVAGQLSPQGIREAIHTFQEGVIAAGANEGQDACPLTHTFINGVYAREILMFEGQTVVGRIHRHAHLNFIMRGKVRVLTEHEGAKEYTAPCMFVSQAGTKRLVHVLEDCLWVTVHPTSKTTPEEAVEELTTLDYNDIELTTEFEVLP